MNDKEAERTLKAFANKRRVAIVRFVKKSKKASVSDIAEAIKLSFRSTSRHLAVLSSADVLEKEQRGLHIFYRISSDLPATARRILSIF